MGERLGDRRPGREHDRLRRHEAARGVRRVRQQAPDRLGLLGLHEAEELLGLGAGQVGEQVGGVVGVHLLEDVGGAVGGEVAQEVLLLGGRQLLEHVGQAVVAEAVGDVVAAPLREVHQRVGDVGGAHVLVRGQQLLGALPGLRERQPRDRGPGQHLHRAPPSEPSDELAHRQARDQPVAAALVLHEDVDDLGVGVVVDHADAGVEHLADDEHLVGSLGERAEVDLPGGQRHRGGVDGGDPQHRHEDAAPRADADDQPEHARRPRTHGHRAHRVAHPADPLPVRSEDGQPDHAGDEHPAHGGSHRSRLAVGTCGGLYRVGSAHG